MRLSGCKQYSQCTKIFRLSPAFELLGSPVAHYPRPLSSLRSKLCGTRFYHHPPRRSLGYAPPSRSRTSRRMPACARISAAPMSRPATPADRLPAMHFRYAASAPFRVPVPDSPDAQRSCTRKKQSLVALSLQSRVEKRRRSF